MKDVPLKLGRLVVRAWYIYVTVGRQRIGGGGAFKMHMSSGCGQLPAQGCAAEQAGLGTTDH